MRLSLFLADKPTFHLKGSWFTSQSCYINKNNAHFLDKKTGKTLTVFHKQKSFLINYWVSCHAAEVPSSPRAEHLVRPSHKATCFTLTAIIYSLGLLHEMEPGLIKTLLIPLMEVGKQLWYKQCVQNMKYNWGIISLLNP